MTARRKSRSPYIAAADMFACFAVVMLLKLLEQSHVLPDPQVVQEERRLEMVQQAVEERKEERRAEEKKKKERLAEAEAEIQKSKAALAERQKEFQNWDIVVRRFSEYSNLTREPDHSFFLRTSGIYTAGNSKKWTKDGVTRWMKEMAAGHTRENAILVAVYTENGANDFYRVLMDAIDAANEPAYRIDSFFILLPSGVKAGPDQMIHPKSQERK